MLIAWQYYCCGEELRGYPPFRLLSSKDMSTSDKKKRLSQFLGIMGRLKEKLVSIGGWVEHPTVEQANTMYASVSGDVVAYLKGSSADRVEQINWRTVVNKMPSKRRKVVVENDDDDE
jgi:hypothetical protein